MTVPTRSSSHWGHGQEPTAAQHEAWSGRAHQWSALVGRGPGRLVDVGCGFGHFVAWASSNGWDATGVEPDDWARQRTVAAGRVVASLEQAGVDADVVTAWDVFEHMEDPIAFGLELRPLLRPGGRLFVCSPDFVAVRLRWHLARRDDERFFELVRPDEHAVQFTRAGLVATLQRAGYVDVRSIHPPLARRRGRLAEAAGRVPGVRRGLFVVATAPPSG